MLLFKFPRLQWMPCCPLVALLFLTACTDRELRKDAAKDPLACALLVAQDVIPQRSRDSSIGDVADKYADLKQFDKALKIARSINVSSLRVATILHIARKYRDAGQKEQSSKLMLEASRLTEDMDRQELQEGFVLASLAQQYAVMNDPDQALKVVERIKDWEYPKEDVIKTIATKYAETGDFGRGVRMAQSLPSPFYHVAALVGIAEQYHKAGQDDKAVAELGEAMGIAQTDPKLSSRVSSMAAIAGTYSDISQSKRGLEILADAAQANSQKSRDATDEQGEYHDDIVAMANAYAKCGKNDQAVLWAGKIEMEHSRVVTIIELAQPDQFDAVRHSIQGMSDAYDKADALTKLAMKYWNAGQKEMASALLEEALTAAHSLEMDHRAYALESIGSAFAEIGNIVRSAEVLADSLEAAKALTEDWQKSSTLAEIAMIYAESGQPVNQRGLKILHEIASQYW